MGGICGRGRASSAPESFPLPARCFVLGVGVGVLLTLSVQWGVDDPIGIAHAVLESVPFSGEVLSSGASTPGSGDVLAKGASGRAQARASPTPAIANAGADATHASSAHAALAPLATAAPLATPAPAATPAAIPAATLAPAGPPPAPRPSKYGRLGAPEPTCWDPARGVPPEVEAEAAAAAALRAVPLEDVCKGLEAWVRDTVASQLAPWAETGVSEAMFVKAVSYDTRVGGVEKIRVQKDFKFLGNMPWAQYLQRAAKAWPFAREEYREFMVAIENADWPFMVKDDPAAGPPKVGPVFGNTNNGRFWNILMPVQNRPQFDDSFMKTRATTLELGAAVKWADRKDIAVWRGTLGCSVGCGQRGKSYTPDFYLPEHCRDDSPNWNVTKIGIPFGCMDATNEKTGIFTRHWRPALVIYNAACGNLCGINAKFADISGEHRGFVENYTGKDGIRDWIGGFVDDKASANHRYIIHVGNNGYSDRSWRMFALGAVVMIVDTGFVEWYWSFLKPWVHYVPLKGDSSDGCEKLAWLRRNPTEAERIAARGRAFIDKCLDVNLVNLYCAEVMRQLGLLWAKGNKK